MDKPAIKDKLAAAEAVKQQLQIEPQHSKGQIMARTGAITAMTDISDGLVANLAKLCSASGCGAILQEEAIPVARSSRIIAEENNVDPLRFALFGGEDYELVATIKESKIDMVRQKMTEQGYKLHIIGQCTGQRGIHMNGQPLEITGFDHFRQ